MDSLVIAALAFMLALVPAAYTLGRRARRAAGAEMADSGRRQATLRGLVENSPRGIHFYELDADDRLVFAGYNDAAERILGVDHASLVGKEIEEAFPSLAGTEIPRRYLEAARDGAPWQAEQVDYEDGAIRGAYSVTAFGTRPRSMAAIFSDITEDKRAELELEGERAFTKAVLESLPGIFYLYDYPGLRLRLWNRNHETAFGFSPDEMRGRDLFLWHLPEAREAVSRAVESCMRDGSAQIEAPLVAKDGRRIPFLLTGRSFEAGGRSYLMGVGIDISERLAAEEKLHVLNEELESRVSERTRLLSEANETLSETLRELKESQRKMLLGEKMAALGQLIAGIAHELNTPLGAILSASATIESSVASLPSFMAWYRDLPEAAVPAFGALSSGLVSGAARGDLEGERARRKRIRGILESAGLEGAEILADQLAEAGYEGEEAELAVLAQIPRFPEIVSMAYGLDTFLRADYVVKAAAEKAARVVLALRTYAWRDPSESLSLADPREQLETVLVLLENRLKRGVEVVRDYGELGPVPCYPDRLAQVWMNLINNAIQAMEYRGRLELIAREEPGDRGGFVAVSVVDDGPGIPEAIRHRIFEPFFTTKAPGEGSGLGLDICRRILDEIGASIDFESEPGRTRFTVRLPSPR